MRSEIPSRRDLLRWPVEWGGDRVPTDRVQAWEITPRELRRRLDEGQPLVLVDVREPWEAEIASLPGALLIPYSEFRYRAEEELYPDDEIVLFCHYGDRSLEAAVQLWDLGYVSVSSLLGGIEQWSAQVDPDLPRY